MNNFLIVSKLKSVDIKDPSLWTALSNILNNSSVKHLQPIIDIITSPWIDLMTNDRVGDVDSNAVVTVLVLIKIIMKVDISPFYIAKLFHLISLYPLRLFQKYVASWLLTLEYAELKLFLHRIKHSCDRLIEAGKASEDFFGLANLLASFPLNYYQNLSITQNISIADISDLEIDELCYCLQYFMWSFEYMLCNDKIDSDPFIRNQLIAWVQFIHNSIPIEENPLSFVNCVETSINISVPDHLLSIAASIAMERHLLNDIGNMENIIGKLTKLESPSCIFAISQIVRGKAFCNNSLSQSTLKDVCLLLETLNFQYHSSNKKSQSLVDCLSNMWEYIFRYCDPVEVASLVENGQLLMSIGLIISTMFSTPWTVGKILVVKKLIFLFTVREDYLAFLNRLTPTPLEALTDVLFCDNWEDENDEETLSVLVALLKVVISYSISRAELNHLWTKLNDQLCGLPNYKRLALMTLTSIKDMLLECATVKSPTPSEYFSFRGPNTGIQLPSLPQWIFPSGFTILTQFHFNVIGTNFDKTGKQFILTSWQSSTEGVGFEIYFVKPTPTDLGFESESMDTIQLRLLIRSRSTADLVDKELCNVKSSHVIGWKFFGFSFSKGSNGIKSVFTVYMDGEVVARTEISYPRFLLDSPLPILTNMMCYAGEDNKSDLIIDQASRIFMFSEILSQNAIVAWNRLEWSSASLAETLS